jgi:hypothetical protein
MSERWRELLGLLDELAPPADIADRRPGADANAGARPRAGRGRTRLLVGAAVLAVVALASGLALLAHHDSGGRSAARSVGRHGGGPSPGPGPNDRGLTLGRPRRGAELLGVAASGPNDVWAAGMVRRNREIQGQSLLEHWNGTSWRSVSCPNVGELRAVTVAAPGDVWAVGDSGLVHWHDGHCGRIPPPRVGGEIAVDSIAAAGPHSVWICGERPGTHFPASNFTGWNTLVARWDGSSWHVYQTPNRAERDNYLQGIVAVSPTDVWAGGYSQTTHGIPLTLILHWDGSTWQIARTPNPGRSLNVIWGMGYDAHHVWALGHYSNDQHNDRLTGLLLRLVGTTWKTTSPPSDHRYFTAAALSGTGADDAWAVGGWPNGPVTLIHYDGTHWTTDAATDTATAKQSTLADVVAITPSDAWAVGVTSGIKELGERPLIEHWDGTTWRTETLPLN